MSRLTLIVAATKTNGIGQEARLPWHLPKEMSYFANVTSKAPEGKKNAVIMGRNTWESIPKKYRPLPKRINLVVSRKTDYVLQETARESSPANLHHSLESAAAQLSRESDKIHRAFVIGGALLYSQCLSLPSNSSVGFVDRVLLTRIHSPSFDQCDVFMPDFLGEWIGSPDSNGWKRIPNEAHSDWVGFPVPEGEQDENGVQYEFQLWARDA
ncbi:dihydrofolate reductase [Dendrothele bispora CBS 962.96]|uniref:Dihydrofolate reductase n=1 Tax=Dendrothele bispora (strain CBS 962.96) TaxID=1314807 RepID=A0A4S8MQ19_DENBC|nr:dihydrofolate reductase [Dendrothele bispora CBS 962.96]